MKLFEAKDRLNFSTSQISEAKEKAKNQASYSGSDGDGSSQVLVYGGLLRLGQHTE